MIALVVLVTIPASLVADEVRLPEWLSGAAEVRLPEWLSGAAEVRLASGYRTEGVLINDEPLLQSSLTLLGHGFGLNLSANYDLTDNYYPDGPGFTEVVLGLSYLFDLEEYAFSLGFSEIFYPNTDRVTESAEGELVSRSEDATHLVYLYVERPDWFVVPQLSLDYALGSDSAFFGRFALLRSVELAPQLRADLTVSLAWASGSYHALWMAPRQRGWRDLAAKAGVEWRLSDDLALRASIEYSYLISDTIAGLAREHGYKEPGTAVGLLGLNWRF